MPEQILKPDDQRKCHPASACLVDHIHQIDGLSVSLGWHHLDIPGTVDVKVAAPPPIDIIEGYGGRNIPRFSHFEATVCDEVLNSTSSCKKTAPNRSSAWLTLLIH